MSPEHPKRRNSGASYEEKDAEIRVIIFFGVALLAAVMAVGLVGRFTLHLFSRPATSGQVAGPPPARPLPPEPRLEADPQAGLQALRREEDALLHRYAWVDRSKGVVRIPIERAMDLMVQRGLPARHVIKEKQ